jgi:hypothetical protein
MSGNVNFCDLGEGGASELSSQTGELDGVFAGWEFDIPLDHSRCRAGPIRIPFMPAAGPSRPTPMPGEDRHFPFDAVVHWMPIDSLEGEDVDCELVVH